MYVSMYVCKGDKQRLWVNVWLTNATQCRTGCQLGWGNFPSRSCGMSIGKLNVDNGPGNLIQTSDCYLLYFHQNSVISCQYLCVFVVSIVWKDMNWHNENNKHFWSFSYTKIMGYSGTFWDGETGLLEQGKREKQWKCQERCSRKS